MEELLQKLLEAEILSAETKSELEDAFKAQLDEAIAAAKENAAADVRTQLTEQWVRERDALIEAIDTKVGDYLEGEIDELREDIDRFRDLEAEYAQKLVEEKAAMSAQLKADLAELVEKIDSFLEIRLAAEIEELREDINVVRRNDFGRRVFEAFAREFVDNYADEDSAAATLRETEERLVDTVALLEQKETQLLALQRKIKLDEVLAPLSGRQKEVMEAILRNVDTQNLEEGYKTFIGRVIRETTKDSAISEKEGKVLAEGEKKSDSFVTKGVIITGDKEEVINESVSSEDAAAAARRKEYIQKLAGIK
jgi:hypothetical protein